MRERERVMITGLMRKRSAQHLADDLTRVGLGALIMEG